MRTFLSVFLLLSIFSFQVCAENSLSLIQALDKVEAHPDYQSWLKSVAAAEQAVKTITDKQKPQLELGGQILSLGYNLDKQASSANTSPSLSFSQKSLSGTSFGVSFSPSKELAQNSDWNLKWSLSISQTIRPSPRLSADSLSLLSAGDSLTLLEAQRDYVLQNARFKIEELYKTAQVVEAQVLFSRENLRVEKEALQTALQKAAIGEGGKVDLITARLGVLRAEKELEQTELKALIARNRLEEALNLPEPIVLEPLQMLSSLNQETDSVPEYFSLAVAEHPLVLRQLFEIEKVKRELSAAFQSRKPGAAMAFSLGEAPNSHDLQIKASLSVNYNLLSSDSQKESVQTKTEALDLTRKSYQKEVQNLEQIIQESRKNLESMARDLEIAELTLAKAKLELETARQLFFLGALDHKSLERQEIQFSQIQLSHWEINFQYDLMQRRFASGILGDLEGIGGVVR